MHSKLFAHNRIKIKIKQIHSWNFQWASTETAEFGNDLITRCKYLRSEKFSEAP
jgi:hypothetical protein